MDRETADFQQILLDVVLDSSERPAESCSAEVISMRQRVETFDWSSTPLGARSDWPAELRIMVQQILDSHFPKAIVWGPEHTTIYNDAFLPILGNKPDALGKPFSVIWSEVWDEIGPIVDRAYAGVSTYIEDFPLTIDRFGQPEDAWFTFCYSPLRRADGSVAGMLDTVVETTGKVLAQADLALANRELAHRLKNTLTVVQAIASQTLRGVADEDAMSSFNNRLGALAHAHDVLVRQNWSDVSLLRVATASVEPHNGGGQIRIEGPNMKIGSHSAVSLSLMLHELATNAIKYGALSVPGGEVRLSWRVEEDALHFIWYEEGGPRIKEPERLGFGSRLISMGVGSSSSVERSYPPHGFRLDMTVPVSVLAH